MNADVKTISINGLEYVLKDSADSKPAESVDGLRYVIVRTQSAGVFAGFLKLKEGQEVTLLNARRLWYWDGAASLSELSQQGVSKPQNCKFPQTVTQIELLQCVEVISCTEKAKKSIEGVAIWKS